jgi:hypothetical protein
MYYDPRELWPCLVRAGFRPRDIRCHRHKLGLNTFAVCAKTGTPELRRREEDDPPHPDPPPPAGSELEGE